MIQSGGRERCSAEGAERRGKPRAASSGMPYSAKRAAIALGLPSGSRPGLRLPRCVMIAVTCLPKLRLALGGWLAMDGWKSAICHRGSERGLSGRHDCVAFLG